MPAKWIQFTVAPTDAVTFEAEISRLVRESLSESGCVHYTAYRDTENPGVFTVLEAWESDEAFTAHRNSPHVARFKEKCGSVILKKTGQSLAPVE